VQLVLLLDILRSRDNHAGHKAAQGCDAIPLTDSNHRCIDMSCTRLQGTIGIGNSAASIVVKVGLNVYNWKVSPNFSFFNPYA